MDAIREIVSGNALSSIIKLPKWLRDKQVEVIVFPVGDQSSQTGAETTAKITKRELNELKKNSLSVKLTGAINHPPVTLSMVREERLSELYDRID